MSVLEVGPVVVARLPRDDEPLFEVVNSQIVELPPMRLHSTKLASRLLQELGGYADAQGLGVVVAETLFRLPLEHDPKRSRRPEVAFVSYHRWPKDRPESVRENAWVVVPELAIEVVSPSDLAEDLLDKISEFFEAGIRQVWVVYPRPGLVHIYDSIETLRVVGPTGTLDGSDILPGLNLPLKDLFVFPAIHERDSESADDE